MQTLKRRSRVMPQPDRRGLTIVEVLVLLILLVQLLALFLPAVQKVREAAARMKANPQWGPFAGTVGDYGLLAKNLGTDTRTAAWKSIQDGEIDLSAYGDLKDRYTAAIALGTLLAQQTQACIDTETNPLVDLQLKAMRDAILQSVDALELSQESIGLVITLSTP